mgnify:CR=1 FL=1
MKNLPKASRIYLIIVYILTTIFMAMFYKYDYFDVYIADYLALVFFSILIALTESYTVIHKNISFSTTFAVELAVFMLFGPFFAMTAVVLGFSLRYVKDTSGKYRHIFNSSFAGTIFNYCVLILPIILSYYIYLNIGGTFVFINFGSNLFEVTVFSLICFLINLFLISIMMTTYTKKNLFFTFFSNIRLGFINFLIMVPFGIMLAMMYQAFGYLGVLFLFFPIVLVRFTFSLYIDSKNQFIQTVDSLMRAVEARDSYTEGHSHRVAKLVEMISRELKYSEAKVEQMNMAAVLHDVGKIGINDYILNKPGRLTDEEYNLIKNHPEIGYNILKDVKGLENVLELVRDHHERYDGKGYPNGKSKEDLSFEVFIIQLADAIDAMATDRPYRKGLTDEEIDVEVERNRGTQFHPKVVDAYLKAKGKKIK